MIDDLRIPVVSKEAAIQFPDGILIPGLVYIPSSAPDHDGPMRLVEWLNDGDAFFPFKAHGEEAAALVNKANVLSLTAYHEGNYPRGDSAQGDYPPPDSDGYDEFEDAPRIAVHVDTPLNKFEGQMIADMPQNKNRTLDILNNGAPFVFLVNDGREIHINKKFITKAMEIERV